MKSKLCMNMLKPRNYGRLVISVRKMLNFVLSAGNADVFAYKIADIFPYMILRDYCALFIIGNEYIAIRNL